jgi:hypothetical protein
MLKLRRVALAFLVLVAAATSISACSPIPALDDDCQIIPGSNNVCD